MKYSLSTQLETSRPILKQTDDVATSQPGSAGLCTCFWLLSAVDPFFYVGIIVFNSGDD